MTDKLKFDGRYQGKCATCGTWQEYLPVSLIDHSKSICNDCRQKETVYISNHSHACLWVDWGAVVKRYGKPLRDNLWERPRCYHWIIDNRLELRATRVKSEHEYFMVYRLIDCKLDDFKTVVRELAIELDGISDI